MGIEAQPLMGHPCFFTGNDLSSSMSTGTPCLMDAGVDLSGCWSDEKKVAILVI